MLEQTWRWFGSNDRISLAEIKQTGVTGIVSALHQIPTGQEWSRAEIAERKKQIEESGLTWSVVESIPVHEDIKRRTGNFNQYIENYKNTIFNLGQEGIKTVCYNFMPVTDWSRTNLKMKFKDGAESLSFSYVHFIIVDLFILKRRGAEKSYDAKLIEEAKKLHAEMSDEELNELKDTFLLGFPGSGETFSVDEVNAKIEGYAKISKEQFREHLKAFLNEIIPIAESVDIKMAIHPDDPPWSLLGLPRIVGTMEDVEYIINAYDSPSNGLTFCTGSLGSAYFNDLNTMSEKLAHRINFAHLRNVSRDTALNFHENYLFEGDVDMYTVVKNLLIEQDKRKKEGDPDFKIPYRPDHGQQILGDLNMKNYPGYSLYGRMKSLAEIRGLELGISRNLNIEN